MHDAKCGCVCVFRNYAKIPVSNEELVLAAFWAGLPRWPSHPSFALAVLDMISLRLSIILILAFSPA